LLEKMRRKGGRKNISSSGDEKEEEKATSGKGMLMATAVRER